VNCKNVSATSWPFSSGDPGARLGEEVRRLTKVENFDLAVVLGSGWNEAATLGETLGVFDYSDWPCFPCGQVAGHAGQLIAVRYSSWNILFFSGRFHCYQGLSAFEASFPARLASSLGCPRILLTCATGGINPAYRPGDFMLVDDHLNLLGDNPLRGLSGNTFVDMVAAYQSDVYTKLLEGDCSKMTLHSGVLAAMSGPSYETPAEVRFLSTTGADVVSMSTVPEVIMARYLGLQVAAVAFISNVAAGLSSVALSHEDVLDCSDEHSFLFPLLIRNFVDAWQAVPDQK
jgi:purine-nucleoside phosphorylase